MSERSPCVLIVEDDADHRALMARRLSDEGIPVVEAASGEEALERLDGVHLVLLDYRLPRATGLDVLGQMRAHPNPPSVVMVTGMGSERVAVDVLRAGAVDYVIKDTGYLDTLVSVVERAWRHHELAVRARRLQDLALMVASATDRHVLFREVLDGARELLGVDASGLYLEREEGLRLAATSADDARDRLLATSEVGEDVRGARLAGGVLARPGRMVVCLPAEGGETAGAIVVVAGGGRAFTPAEVRLAQTFAAFAGTALRHLDRLELERALADELQRTLDHRRNFEASISHELRTPLTCITGFGHTLIKRWERLTEEERRELVERMHRHGLELWDLVNQLLDVAAEERGRLEVELEDLDLPEVVAATIQGLTPLIGDRRVEVLVPGVRVKADRRLLGRALANLLSNAVKYSPPGRPVTVSATEERGKREVRVDVIDEGEGIEPGELTQVFEPFWRGDAARLLAARGTGIGLALVREYVRLMHGQTFAVSEPGRGSTFSFTLPLVGSAAVATGGTADVAR